MKAVVYEAIERLDVAEIEEPRCEPGDIVVRVALCGICGSDLASYRRGALVSPGQVMGHEFAGTVVEAGAQVEGIAVGARVTASPLQACGSCRQCRAARSQLCEGGLSHVGYGLPGAFAPLVRIPQARLGSNVHLLPDEVDDAAGALVEPFAVALHAVRFAAPSPSDTCVVMGLGPIGLAVTQILRARGVGAIVGVELSQLRSRLAREMGADAVVDGRDGPLADQITAATAHTSSPGSVDYVFETSGVDTLLQASLDVVRPGGEIRVVALHARPVALDAGAVVAKELTIAGSNTYHDEFPLVIDLMRRGRLQTDLMVSDVLPLDSALAGFEAQLDPERAVKIMIRPV